MAVTRASNVVVGDILEDTIVRSTKSQTTADGELVWLRARLDAKRKANSYYTGKLALEGDSTSKEQSALDKAASGGTGGPADKENSLTGASGGALHMNKV